MSALVHATESWWGIRSIWRHANLARPRHIKTILARIARRSAGIEDEVADRYSGCGWDDETERRLLDDVFSGRRGSLIR